MQDLYLISRTQYVSMVPFRYQESSNVELSRVRFDPFSSYRAGGITHVGVADDRFANGTSMVEDRPGDATFRRVAHFEYDQIAADSTNPLITKVPGVINVVRYYVQVPDLFIFRRPVIGTRVQSLRSHVNYGHRCLACHPIRHWPVFMVHPHYRVNRRSRGVFSFVTCFIERR